MYSFHWLSVCVYDMETNWYTELYGIVNENFVHFRSTPCPNVKHGDEWCDPTQCENLDNCVYCHTRTEQQFHPEVSFLLLCGQLPRLERCPAFRLLKCIGNNTVWTSTKCKCILLSYPLCSRKAVDLFILIMWSLLGVGMQWLWLC